MPIPLPLLDDRRYEDLVAEMRALIPHYAPEWTDHNASDPGIMLVELFAWLTEALIYRLNRIPEESELRFLQLLDAEAYKAYKTNLAKIKGLQRLDDGQADRVDAFHKATRKIWTPWRAVTAKNFEDIATKDERVARAKCLPEIDLTICTGNYERIGHVSLVIVERSNEREPETLLKETLLNDLTSELEQRRLINTRIHIVSPRYVPVYVKAEVVLTARAKLETVRNSITERLTCFFDPGKGNLKNPQERSAARQINFEPWQFGKPVTTSEVHQVIDETPGVDYVYLLHLWGRRFLFCVSISSAIPQTDVPEEVKQLRAGHLPNKLWQELKRRNRDLLSAASLQVVEVEEKKRWIIGPAFNNGAKEGYREGYEVVWHRGLPNEDGLLDVYGPFMPAKKKDGAEGIEQIELPIDGLVYFDKERTKIT